MNTSNIKRLKIAGKEVKYIKIGGKVAWQGFPEYTIGGTKYAPETFPQWHTLTGNTTINFSNWDNSSYKLTAYIIGGGGAGGRAHAYANAGWEDGWSWTHSGAGGEGGEVISVVPSIIESTNYSIVIGGGGSAGDLAVNTDPEYEPHRWTTANNSGDGGNSSAFGYTANGGKGATTYSGDNTFESYEYIPGASGTSGADGGHGGRACFYGPCFWTTDPDIDPKYPSIGNVGTNINGTIYGSGGSGGGIDNEFIYASGYSFLHKYVDAAASAPGHGNYGSGGNGESFYNHHGAMYEMGYWPSSNIYSKGGQENGTQGAVIIKIEER